MDGWFRRWFDGVNGADPVRDWPERKTILAGKGERRWRGRCWFAGWSNISDEGKDGSIGERFSGCFLRVPANSS
ncbi:hypothetical protein FXO38_17121 [Capsicum annuum]|nr:hypothetical protein FXO38_17121 [Capsicum annuum]